MAKKIEIREGKINLAGIIAHFCKNPAFQSGDEGYIRATLATNYPELLKKEICFNCDASMKQNVYFFDILTALFLLEMGKEVRRRLDNGLDFTVANQVKVKDLPIGIWTKCRTTSSKYLGLVARLKGANKHYVKNIWVITSRGFAALKGERVPARVKVWRKKIEERFDETITLSEAFKVHREGVEASIARDKYDPKTDYRQFADDYNPQDWVGFGGYHEGNLSV